MRTFGRILAYSVIVASVISMVFSVVGVIGLWTTYPTLVGGLTQMANVAESALKTADEALTQIEPLLAALEQSMVEVQKNAEQLTAEIQSPGALVDILLNQLSGDVRPKMEKALAAFTKMRDVANTVNSTVQTLNSLPFLNLMGIGDLQPVVDSFDQVVQAINELQGRVDRLKTGVTTQLIQPIAEQAVIIEERLADTQTRVKAAHARVQLAYQSVVALKGSIGTIVFLLFLVFSFQMLWGLVAQSAAIYVAWMYLKFGQLKIHKLVQAPSETPAA